MTGVQLFSKQIESKCPDKKILIVCTNSDEAGAPRHVEEIAKYLNLHYRLRVVFGGDSPGPVQLRLDKQNIPTHLIPDLKTKASFKNDIGSIKHLSQLIDKYKPDVINCHSTKAALIARIIGALNFIPVVFTLHGWGWRGLSLQKKVIVYLIELFFSLPIFKIHYIFVDAQSYETGIKIFPWIKNNSILIFNGVPYPSIENKTKPYIDNTYNILMPARVDRAKNHFALATAFENTASDDWRLIFCGQNTDSQSFIHRISKICTKRINQVIFLGQISTVHEYYREASIVALISNYEALPLSLLEALSHSLPIIASDVGGVSITVSNHNGILVKNNDIFSIGSALKKMHDPMIRYEMGKKSYKLFENLFTQEHMLNKLQKFYLSLLG